VWCMLCRPDHFLRHCRAVLPAKSLLSRTIRRHPDMLEDLLCSFGYHSPDCDHTRGDETRRDAGLDVLSDDEWN
jgi:hypothetical protein